MTMHERIKKLRKDSGLTQAEFGERIGITFSSVSLLEKGKNNPSEQTIRAICSEFHINRDWLVDGIGDMKATQPLLPELIHNLRQYPNALMALIAIQPEEWKVLDALVLAGTVDKALLEPAPVAVVTGYGESAIQYSLRVWVKTEDYWDVYFTVNQRVKEIFDDQGVAMTYPHLNVHLDK